MAIEMMSISHCYCSDYMTKPTQFGDEPKILTNGIFILEKDFPLGTRLNAKKRLIVNQSA